jgi:hypothetical protein
VTAGLRVIPRRRAPLLAAGAGAWLVAAGCASVLGIEPLQEDPCGGFAFAEEGCASCLRRGCCSAALSCAADEACTAGFACLAACAVDDPECRNGCREDSPDALASPTYAALDACERDACVDECLGDGGWSDFLGGDATCNACVVDHCSESILECMRSATCEAASACIVSCDDPACLVRCTLDDLRTTPEVSECALNCSAECALVEDFACVSNFHWYTDPVPENVDLRLKIVDADGGAAITGARVRACMGVDCLDCFNGPSAVTDDTGITTIGVPYKFDGCFAIEADGFVDSLAHIAPVLGDAQDPQSLGMLSEETLAHEAEALGVDLLAERGHIAVRQDDCRFNQGIEVSIFAEGPGGPAMELPPFPGPDRGALLNVEPGALGLVSYDDGEIVSRRSVYIRASTVTTVVLFPLAL